MVRKIVFVILLIAAMSVSVYAAGFMGPPTADLNKGQADIGYSYSYSDIDLDNTKRKEVEFNAGVPDTETTPIKIKDFKVQRHYFNFSYGLTDNWEIYGQFGGADVKAQAREDEPDEDWTGYNFDNDFAWGWGTRITLLKQEAAEWGISTQMNWLDTSTSYLDEDDDKNTDDLETYDLLVAAGPTFDMGGWKLYGGPFYYYLSGDWDNKGSATTNPDFTWKYNADIKSESVGGFIGAQFALAERTDLTTELSATSDGWAVGTGIKWKF